MGALILVLCSLPPLAVLAVAVLNGFRTGSSTALSILALSALVLSLSVAIPRIRDEVPVQSVQLASPVRDNVAASSEALAPIRLTRRSEAEALYR